MSENHNTCSSVTTNYNHKDITVLNANETHIKSDQMEFDFGERDIAENGTAPNADTGNFLISAILNADPELAEDIKNRTEADEEKRIEKLRENGAKGGRTPIDRGELAKRCLDAVFSKHSEVIVRH